MYDLHNHVLPGVDDGAADLPEALALLALASEQGISHLLATPHIQPGHYENAATDILIALQRLQTEVLAAGIPITLAAAAEVRLSPELVVMAERQSLPFIGQLRGCNVLLLELPPSHIPAGTDRLVQWLLKRNILPMIAHPERNRELLAQPDKLDSFVRAGCLFQLTAAALLGDMGAGCQCQAEQWLIEGIYHIVASDAHSVARRPPKLRAAYEKTRQLLNDAEADKLFISHPQQLSTAVFEQQLLLA